LTDSKEVAPKTQKQEKRFGLADPVAWDAINRSLMQQQQLSDLIDADDPVAVPVRQSSKKQIDSVSRTPSQRKLLDQFAKELGKYAEAAGAAGKAPVITPTISESRASVHTIKPLVPYKDEFLAAGLSVMSAEQRRSLNNKVQARSSHRRSRPYKTSNGPSRARQVLDRHGHGTTSRPGNSTSWSNSGSYVEFSPPNGYMSHIIEPLFQGKANKKTKHCHRRKRLLSWFLNKPSDKDGGIYGQPVPARTRQIKGGHIESNNPSSPRHDHRLPRHRSHRPTMQSAPGQSTSQYALPTRYVTSQKEKSVALTAAQSERSDQGLHPTQDGGLHGPVFNARPSPDGIALQGKRARARCVLPKACPEPIETIEEVTETTLLPAEHSRQDRFLPPAKRKGVMTATVGTYQHPVALPSTIDKTSVPSLPFIVRYEAGTTSSLQRALDDACRKLDGDNLQVNNEATGGKLRQNVRQDPQQDPRQCALHKALPPKPLLATKPKTVEDNIPKAETVPLTNKPLPPEPVSKTQATPERCSNTKPPSPSRKVPAPPRPLTGKRKNAVAELAKAEEMLKDLDVFLSDYDDANIKDRDVIKGLQVATHAAADDLYDAYLRHKTGLRIRRFLADLKSFEDTSAVGSTNPQSGERRAESKRLRHVHVRNDPQKQDDT
jgi:hypothetical protein